MFDYFKSARKIYDDLDGKTFKTKLESTSEAELLDVRSTGEFRSGTIAGAKNLDVSSREFQTALNTLDKNKEYFVFCRSGNRSGIACEMLADQGFKAYNLSGGIGAWPRA